jgi:hypothetical protein
MIEDGFRSARRRHDLISGYGLDILRWKKQQSTDMNITSVYGKSSLMSTDHHGHLAVHGIFLSK